uniref:Uncharacterized protein n=1 Tax=Pristionchus pacificus TaxID=54126 RepID=A0A2A6C2Z3_PRIPA|eukprot:PDM72500.1 hypothetical protein PRIPAC_38934 [Pristionchus pacificus]
MDDNVKRVISSEIRLEIIAVEKWIGEKGEKGRNPINQHCCCRKLNRNPDSASSFVVYAIDVVSSELEEGRRRRWRLEIGTDVRMTD